MARYVYFHCINEYYFKLSLCTDGIPHDGIPEEEIVTIHLSVTVIFILLSSAGVVFTVACLLFNFAFRNRKWVFKSLKGYVNNGVLSSG